jgi:hypothetical protein
MEVRYSETALRGRHRKYTIEKVYIKELSLKHYCCDALDWLIFLFISKSKII